jgi:hypothetical protein
MESRPSVRQYRDENHEWWWEVTGCSGKVIGRSTQSFKKRVSCSNNMAKVAAAMTPPMNWKQKGTGT